MQFPIANFKNTRTPFYYYDMVLLEQTIKTVKSEADKYGYTIHYALKANANEPILKLFSSMNIGADCVSGAEVQRALDCGFPADTIAFAGVGKRDDEINLAIDNNIFSLNCESEQEIEVVNELAKDKGKIASIALRINPNVDAHTHHHITTGTDENKFGINLWQLEDVVKKVQKMANVKLISIHFHVGSQITNMDVFKALSEKVNEIQEQLSSWGVMVEHINVGGGLGVNYQDPDGHNIPDFASYFKIFADNLKLKNGQKLHVELGRSMVAQCGSLISKVLYTKELKHKNFAILDAGFTDLIRPALYDAYHKIENITSDEPAKKYDVVGPICESSDVFGKDVELPKTKRGDYIAIRSAGAYGQIMASNYNLRSLPGTVYSK